MPRGSHSGPVKVPEEDKESYQNEGPDSRESSDGGFDSIGGGSGGVVDDKEESIDRVGGRN